MRESVPLSLRSMLSREHKVFWVQGCGLQCQNCCHLASMLPLLSFPKPDTAPCSRVSGYQFSPMPDVRSARPYLDILQFALHVSY